MQKKMNTVPKEETLFLFVDTLRNATSNLFFKEQDPGYIAFGQHSDKTVYLDTNYMDKQNDAFYASLTLVRQLVQHVANDPIIPLEKIFPLIKTFWTVSTSEIEALEVEYLTLKNDISYNKRLKMFLYQAAGVHVNGKEEDRALWTGLSKEERYIERKLLEKQNYEVIDISLKLAWIIQEGWLRKAIPLFESPVMAELLIHDFMKYNDPSWINFNKRLLDDNNFSAFIIQDTNGNSIPIVGVPSGSQEERISTFQKIRLNGTFTYEIMEQLAEDIIDNLDFFPKMDQ